jgi:hypothetical protein
MITVDFYLGMSDPKSVGYSAPLPSPSYCVVVQSSCACENFGRICQCFVRKCSGLQLERKGDSRRPASASESSLIADGAQKLV